VYEQENVAANSSMEKTFEKRKEYQKRYYQRHKEKAKEYQKQYNLTHKKKKTNNDKSTDGYEAPRQQKIECHTQHSLKKTSIEQFIRETGRILKGECSYVPTKESKEKTDPDLKAIDTSEEYYTIPK